MGKVPTPRDVSARERIFERDGVLRWNGQSPIGSAVMGGSLNDLLKCSVGAATVTGAIRDSSLLEKIVGIFQDDTYILWYNVPYRTAHIVLKSQASPADQIKAWAIALWTAYRLHQEPLPTSATSDKVLSLVRKVRSDLEDTWEAFLEQMNAQDWDMSVSNLETNSGLRIKFQDDLGHPTP